MKNSIIIIIILAIIGILVLMGNSSTPQSDKAVKIGVVAPLTGSNAEAGMFFKNGLTLAEEEINKNSKVKVSLIYEDSQYKPEVSVTAIKKLVEVNKVNYVIGESGSSQTLAMAPIAEKNKVVLITPVSQASKLTDAGDYIFRTQINVSQEVNFFAPKLFQILGKDKVDIMALNTDYGIDFVDKFSLAYENLGGNLGVKEKFKNEDTDFRTILTKIKNDKPAAILIVGTRKLDGLIMKQAKDLSISARFFASSPIESKEFIETAGLAAEGVIYPYPFDDTSIDSTQKAFQEIYKSKYEVKSEMIAANSYDALMLLSICLDKVGNNSELVKNCLYSIKDYQGASGQLTFDSSGDVTKHFILKAVKNGQFIKLEE